MIIYTLQEFCKFFRPGKPILSIDYGPKKIGIAISTPDHHLPMPLQIVSGESEKKKLQDLYSQQEYIREGGCMWLIGIISIPSILMILL